jgi:hypothetical protein
MNIRGPTPQVPILPNRKSLDGRGREKSRETGSFATNLRSNSRNEPIFTDAESRAKVPSGQEPPGWRYSLAEIEVIGIRRETHDPPRATAAITHQIHVNVHPETTPLASALP